MSDRVAQSRATAEIDYTLQALLLEDLQGVAHKWKSLALYLGIGRTEVKNIQYNVSGCVSLTEHCFPKVINAWLSSDPKNLTKEFLAEAVRNVGDYSLAMEIEKSDLIIDENPRSRTKILKLLGHMKHKYTTLGIHLGVCMSDIREFEKVTRDSGNCLNLTIHHWLQMSEEDAPNKKESLFDALENLDCMGLAQQLKEKYKSVKFPGEEERDDDDTA